jgi:hypothetical protein
MKKTRRHDAIGAQAAIDTLRARLQDCLQDFH